MSVKPVIIGAGLENHPWGKRLIAAQKRKEVYRVEPFNNADMREAKNVARDMLEDFEGAEATTEESAIAALVESFCDAVLTQQPTKAARLYVKLYKRLGAYCDAGR